MRNDRLDQGTATHPRQSGAMTRRPDADPDAEFLRMVVAAVAFVNVDAAGFDLGQRVQFGNYGLRVWPSKKMPCSSLACSTNWLPLGSVARVLRVPRRQGAARALST